MKRSSMVSILKESFIRHMNPDGPANNDEEMYSLILEDLEKAGMLPPIQAKGNQPIPDDCEWEQEEILGKKCIFQSGKKIFLTKGVFPGEEECRYSLRGTPVKELSKGVYLLNTGYVVLEDWLVKVEK